MDNSYFYVILRGLRLSKASSDSRSIRRISGDKEFYSIYPIEKGYFIRYILSKKDMCTFFVFGLSAIRPRDAVRPRPVWTYLKSADFCAYYKKPNNGVIVK